MNRRASARSDGADRTTRARASVATATERRDPLRRRWGRIGGGVLAAVLGGWLAASLYLSADDRTEVLALSNGMQRFEVLERSDLRVVRLSSDTDVASLPASRLEQLIGRIAATDLAAGSLLVDDHLLGADERLVSARDAVVGVLVGPGDAPSSGLVRGASVMVVVRPAAGTSNSIVETSGWVAEVGAAVGSSADRAVAVVVPAEDAAAVSAAAADRRVTLVVAGG